jgi:hypothetical protein
MRNFSTARQVLGAFALSCAMNGVGVAMVTLGVLVWNNSRA